MEEYSGFASFYDLFMDDVPYEQWHAFLIRQLHRYHIEEGLVLDLGCGTGRMTRLLQNSGYDLIGVDRSPQMLTAARQADPDNAGILYLCQDMCEFELYGTVRAIVSVCDSLNYLLEPRQMQRVFSLAYNYLDYGGLFVFDLNTGYKYEHLLGDRTFAENREEGSYIWENMYDEQKRINEYAVTFYVREEDQQYRRFEEIHYQKAYSVDEISQWLSQAGFELRAVYDDYTEKPAHEHSSRICFVAQKCRARMRYISRDCSAATVQK